MASQVPPAGRWKDVESALATWATNTDTLDAVVVARAIIRGRTDDQSPLKVLLDGGSVTRTQVLELLGDALGFGVIDLHEDAYSIEVQTLQNAGASLCLDALVIPVVREGTTHVAAANPKSADTRAALDRMFVDPGSVRPKLADPLVIASRLRQLDQQLTLDQLEDDEDETGGYDEAVTGTITTVAADDSSNVAWLKKTVDRAVQNRASDIHLSLTDDRRLVVEFRVDGEMRQQLAPEANAERVMNAALQWAGMDIGAKRQRQSKALSHRTVTGQRLNIRAELLPTVRGPNLTMRVLDPVAALRRLDHMGLDESYVTTLQRQMAKSNGLIVTSGPTGSGKTTTQYGLLQEMVGRAKKIITIEDPVEYRMSGVTQVEVDVKTAQGLTWQAAIESSLRSDPDILLIGEVRDPATAQASVQASMTGHLVLTTVHTTSAVGVYARLVDLGVERFLVADQLSLAIGQRLVARLHDKCRQKRDVPQHELELLAGAGITDVTEAWYPGGCAICDDTGLQGRTALIELLVPDSGIRSVVMAGGTEDELLAVCSEENYLPFYVDGRRLLLDGVTSPDRLLPLLSERNARIASSHVVPVAEAARRDVA